MIPSTASNNIGELLYITFRLYPGHIQRTIDCSSFHTLLRRGAGSRARAVCATSARAQYRVTRGGRCGFVRDCKQLTSHEPTDSHLRRALGDAYRFCDFSIAHLNWLGTTLLFLRKPQVHKEAHGPTIVCYQVAHQDVNQVIIERDHAVPAISIASTDRLQPWIAQVTLDFQLGG